MPDFNNLLNDAGVPTTDDAAKAQWRVILDEQGSTINNDSDYSPFWRIVAALITAPLLNLINNVLIKSVVPEFYLKTASSLLDDWSSNYNVERKQALPTVGVVTFTRASRNDQAAIPAGTVVISDALNDVVLEYQTKMQAVFSSNGLTTQVEVQALADGQSHNIAGSYINALKTPINNVTVSAGDGWIVQLGQAIETNEALRDRTRASFNTLSSFHTDGVYKAIISSFAGVDSRGVWFRHNIPRGPASADAYVLLDEGIDAQATLAVINNFIGMGNHGHGDDLNVIEMPRTTHNISATLWFDANLLDSDKVTIENQVTAIIQTAFRQVIGNDTVTLTAPFSRFSFSQLSREIHNDVSGLQSIQFDQSDIVSDWSVPKLGTLTLTHGVD